MQIVTTTEAAGQLHLDRSTIVRWVQSGKLRPVHTTSAGQYLFNQKQIDKLIAVAPK